jgi:iron complex transport system ATP-binding protein
LSVSSGPRALLEGIDLSFSAGETWALLGENGAGKSTLLSALAGQAMPRGARQSGQVSLAGRGIREWSPRERARLRAVLPQRCELGFGFTALEVAAMGRCALHGSAGRTTDAEDLRIGRAALELTDAAHLEDRDVTRLSGGEQARVHLASAFAQLWEADAAHPRYLLLDEPTAALDLAHQHSVLRAAREFAVRRSIGVVTVLHDLNLAAQYADRVALLRGGRLLHIGSPREVLAVPNIVAGFQVDAAVLPHPLRACPLIATAPLSRPSPEYA